MLRVSWATNKHPDQETTPGADDGQRVHCRRGEVMLDLGLPFRPGDDFTSEEMQTIAYATKMEALRVLRKRPRRVEQVAVEVHTYWRHKKTHRIAEVVGYDPTTAPKSGYSIRYKYMKPTNPRSIHEGPRVTEPFTSERKLERSRFLATFEKGTEP
jgi:hypothetical protein